MKSLLRLGTALIFCFSAGCSSNPVTLQGVGSSIDFSQLTDQNDHAFVHGSAIKLALYVTDMKAKDLIRDSLEQIDSRCLTDGRVVYVANISKMPGLISRLIAIPRMRKYPYPIWLDRDGAATEGLPAEEGAVSVLSISAGSIAKVEYFSEATALSRRLGRECGNS